MNPKKQKCVNSVVLALFIALAVVLVLTISMYAWFIHTSIWQYNADFENHEAEFRLVCDYVLEYMDGRTGTLSCSHSEGHEHDLYDDKTRKYVDCPEEVRNALEIICRDAFNVNSHFEYIRCEDGEVAFHIINAPYKLAYSPNKIPKLKNLNFGEISLHQYIGNGWYHVSRWSL